MLNHVITVLAIAVIIALSAVSSLLPTPLVALILGTNALYFGIKDYNVLFTIIETMRGKA